MLRLEVPEARLPEHEYVARVLFGELLGVECVVTPSDLEVVLLTAPGMPGSIALPVRFLGSNPSNWLKPSSVPGEFTPWQVPSALRASQHQGELPVLSVDESEARTGIAADLLGTAFFLLTRYEEVALPSLDEHGRQVAATSLLVKGGFIERAVVNEIADVLERSILGQWPSFPTRTRQFRLLVSHDVDHPWCVAGRSPVRIIGGAGRALIREGPGAARRRLGEWREVRQGGESSDPCWTFDWLMSESERRGLQSAFYFIPESGEGAEYQVEDPRLLGLMSEINRRGHEIGVHPSYRAGENAITLAEEFGRMRSVLAQVGVGAELSGGRHHYLRWRAGRSWREWSEAGLHYDSSVGFASTPGFRAGICAEYPVFDLHARRPLPLRERPLMIMDVSLLGAQYLGLGHRDAVDRAIGVARACRRHHGDCVLLWHNDHLRTAADREAYLAILDGALAAA